MRIWGRTNSNNVKKALWAAEEVGVAYDRIDAGGVFGVVDGDDYYALNPNRLVPTLEDGDLILWESNTIVRYLAAAYGDGGLWPSDPKRRALADRWTDWTTTTLFPAIAPAFLGLIRTPQDKRDPAAIEASRAKTADVLKIPESALATQPFLSGDALGFGDIPAGVIIHLWFSLPIERPDYPHLKAWYDRLCERPGYRKVVAVPLT